MRTVSRNGWAVSVFRAGPSLAMLCLPAEVAGSDSTRLCLSAAVFLEYARGMIG